MKKILTLIFITVLSINAFAQEGIIFSNESFESTLKKAKANDKIMFIDIWATWCGPCKRLGKEIFTQKSVGDFFNKNFISYKLLTDPKDSVELKQADSIANKYYVTFLPTLVWIDGDGNLLHYTTGFKSAEDLIEEGRKAMSPEERVGTAILKWNQGDKSFKNGCTYFSVFCDKVDEFDDFFDKLSFEQRTDSLMLGLIKRKMQFGANSKTPLLVASMWPELKKLDNSNVWNGFLISQFEKSLHESTDSELRNTLIKEWEKYNLPFIQSSIYKMDCIDLFEKGDNDAAFKLIDEIILKENNGFKCVLNVMSQVAFMEHKPFNDSQKQKLYTLCEQYDKNVDYIKNESLLICSVCCNDKEKAMEYGNKIIEAVSNIPESDVYIEYIKMLISIVK